MVNRPRLALLAALLAGCSSPPPEAVDDAQTLLDTAIVDSGGPDTAGADALHVDALAPPVDCTGLAKLTGRLTLTLTHGGRQRTAIVNVPASYDATEPVGVVLNFHGFSSNANQQALYSGMEDVAAGAGMVAVHPEGTGLVQGWNAGACCGEAATFKVDDVGFVRALLDELAQKVCVDPCRVFATGISNGAFLSYRLACELSDRIAAVAPVAGAVLTVPCKPARPVPTFHFHGTQDSLVPYDGNLLVGWPGAVASVQIAATNNGCTGQPQPYYHSGDVTCIRWESSVCSSGAEVRLCTVDGGGHTWPGGFDIPIPWLGYRTNDIKASDEIVAFFQAHPMPKP